MKFLRCVSLAALLCTGLAVAPAKAADLALFDHLTGTWDVGYDIYDKDGKLRVYHGQVSYSRILNDGALQEIWTSDAHDKIPQPYSTTIAFLDDKRQRWTEVWIYPAKGYSGVVSGSEADGHIVLTGRDADGTMQRWTTQDIQADSFICRFESSSDDGKTWRLVGMNHMHRHSA